ncbi:MAG: SUMF1/EgtB/PvdO family nonheme iron enzyme [Myxococcales bacterium]|nr:SUMF1/EgtB/PvdO family nonheme iron enzyme [Myxococcales bacterium]
MYRSLLLLCLGAVVAAGACSSSTTNEGSGTGGAGTGGSSAGGSSTGGSSTGGVAGSPSGGASGGGAGGAATGGSGGDAGLACPTGKGPKMAAIGSLYCIDTTEVTNAHYEAFLADIADAGPKNLTDLSVCANSIDYAPPGKDPCPPFGGGVDKDFPVRCVDWCGAYAYCKWAGKRLCGAKTGGPANAGLPAGDGDQWYGACAGPGGADKYFYGDQHEPGRCIDTGQVAPVGSTLGQQNPCASHYYKSVTDMLGNVAEWEDACGGNGDCLTRGGSAVQGGSGVTCATAKPTIRTGKLPEVGFRCCWDESVGK